jgi:hypothetical protein
MPGEYFGLYLIAHGVGLAIILGVMIAYQLRKGKDD